MAVKAKILEKIKNLPDSPGVYFFLGKADHPRQSAQNPWQSVILYIGKATSLRDRVRSYFSGDLFESRGPLIEKMLSEVEDIDFQETDSVLEALILEANLIKKHQPRYNSLSKDDKSFNYVVITDEEFPRVFTVREREILSGKVEDKIKHSFGPYPHGGQLQEALRIVRKIFPFRDKKSKNPHTERFYRQISLAPDTSSERAEKEYKKTIRHIKLFFEGKKGQLIKLLEREMKREVKDQNFEKAAELRNQIFALNHIRDVSLIKRVNSLSQNGNTAFRIEAYDIAHISGKFVVGAMAVVENGELQKSQYRKFKIKHQPGIDDNKALKEVLERRFFHSEWSKPQILVVDGGVAQRNTALRVLESLKVSGVEVVAVVKNQKHKPERILAESELARSHSDSILLANSEAHRFVLAYHRKLRGKLK